MKPFYTKGLSVFRFSFYIIWCQVCQDDESCYKKRIIFIFKSEAVSAFTSVFIQTFKVLSLKPICWLPKLLPLISIFAKVFAGPLVFNPAVPNPYINGALLSSLLFFHSLLFRASLLREWSSLFISIFNGAVTMVASRHTPRIL